MAARDTQVEPRLSISAATTYDASYEEDLAGYAAAGVAGIGIWEYKIVGRDDAALVDALEASGLRATVCVPGAPSMFPNTLFPAPADPRDRLASLRASIKRFARFNPASCLVLASFPPDDDPERARPVIVDGLRAAAETAGEAGVRLVLEPLRRELGTLAVLPSEALALIEEVGATNIDLLLDTWHFWDLPGIREELAAHVGRIGAVQINGRAPQPRSWCDRLLPGEGVIDLPGFIATLESAGYRGWYDVEVFSDNGRYGERYPDSLWALPAAEVARRAVEGFRRAWAAYEQR
ncbi:MAG TPA: sugar phosphate isomerase/epimerase family protein [Acidimicrobiales bacterium]|nr:sugar phosphate isomerase/epimerase family protein [Acidimicrobiales bacterium]